MFGLVGGENSQLGGWGKAFEWIDLKIPYFGGWKKPFSGWVQKDLYGGSV